jgi:hypothetical protein
MHSQTRDVGLLAFCLGLGSLLCGVSDVRKLHAYLVNRTQHSNAALWQAYACHQACLLSVCYFALT